MNIWQILQTEPTTNIRAVKKAYARRSREVHPEENPEEFREIYEAYQKALLYAKFTVQEEAEEEKQAEAASSLFTEDGREDKTEAQETTETYNSDIYKFFWEKEEKLKEKLEEFEKQWEEITKRNAFSTAIECWGEYVRSEDFREIRWNPQVLELLTEKMEKLRYTLEPRLALWDAYGFEEEKRLEYHGDTLRLFEDLIPAYDTRKKLELEEQQRLERIKSKERTVGFIKTVFKFTLLLLCVSAPFYIYNKLTAQRRFVSLAMEIMYPFTSFTKPEKMEKLPDGSVVY